MHVYNYENRKFDQAFLSFKSGNFFVGKSKVCAMTEFSEAEDEDVFDDNTLLLECEDYEYVYISGFEIFNFKADEKIIDYISLMGDNMCPHVVLSGEKCTYFIAHHYKFIENDKIEEGTLLNATNNKLDPFLYHLGKCDKGSFKKLVYTRLHIYLPRDDVEDDVLVEEDEDIEIIEYEEDEIRYYNGTNEVLKIFNQKCIICLENDSDYACSQCGNQSICEHCYQSEGVTLKCVVCRT